MSNTEFEIPKKEINKLVKLSTESIFNLLNDLITKDISHHAKNLREANNILLNALNMLSDKQKMHLYLAVHKRIPEIYDNQCKIDKDYYAVESLTTCLELLKLLDPSV